MAIFQHIAEQVAAATGKPFQPDAPRTLGGGSINDAFLLADGGSRWFVKLNRGVEAQEMFAAEAEGLNEMAAASEELRVPRALVWGEQGGQAYIVMQYLELGGSGGQAAMGCGLAAMHRCRRDRYGWHRDNTIGSTPQPNGEMPDWVAFWRERRLGFQLELAARNGGGRGLERAGDALMAAFPALFSDYTPVASLLHGDLWGGNAAICSDGTPTIYDPAPYYGDREADIAMTELFGGFGTDFYAAYNEAWPLEQGYAVRKNLYNLYHILNHYNLFGGGYGTQAQSMAERLLAELRA